MSLMQLMRRGGDGLLLKRVGSSNCLGERERVFNHQDERFAANQYQLIVVHYKYSLAPNESLGFDPLASNVGPSLAGCK